MFIWRSEKNKVKTHFQQYKEVLTFEELLKSKGKVAANNIPEIITSNRPTGLESSLLVAQRTQQGRNGRSYGTPISTKCL